MNLPSYRLLLVSLAALMVGCGDDTENPDPNNPGGGGSEPTTYVPAPRGAQRPQAVPAIAVDCGSGSGALKGQYFAPNGSTPVAGAFVYFTSGDCWAGTDKDGRFYVKGLPSGATTVRVEKGLFRSQSSATPGSSVSLKVDPAQVKLAYVRGSFDSIQQVLTRLGFTAQELKAEHLSTVDLSTYSAVFLNCGLNESFVYDEVTPERLKAFVQGGGVLYASDWAESYVQAAFPGRVGFLEDTREGKDAVQQAVVLDEGLKRALGREQASINFDSSGWAVIDSVPTGTSVLVRGPVQTEQGATLPDRPYMVQFQEGQGRVNYTSFHNESQTTEDMNVLLEQFLFQL
jgi:hypothetical protein